MAGGKERVLRRRIKSVESSKKITRAMELIAASRIHKAQQRVAAARPYSEQITNVIRNLASAGAGGGHPLLTPRETVRTVGFVVIAADRGLAGGYNSGVLRQAERALKARDRAGPRLRADPRGQEGARLLPLPRLHDRRQLHRCRRQPVLRGRPRSRRGSSPPLRGGRGRPRRHRVHAVPLRRHPDRRHAPVHADRTGHRDRGAHWASGGLRVRARARRHPRPPAAALRRGAALRRAARRRRRPITPPASGP